MTCKPKRCQKGFTLLEILIALAIIAIFWGVGISVTPRLLSSSEPETLARRLAGAGNDARHMAMSQQRPWELLFDLDQGVFYRAPLGAVSKRELRAASAFDDHSADPAGQGGKTFSSRDTQHGELKEQDLIALRREELEIQSSRALRVTRPYDILAFNYGDTDSDIVASAIPEGVRILEIRKQDEQMQTRGRISLVFGPRGFIRPAIIWLEDADSPGTNRYTVYFSGIMPPTVASGIFLPDDDGVLTPVDLP